MNVLYIGELWEGGTCKQRSNAMEELGHDVYKIDSTSKNYFYPIQKIYNLSYKFGYPIDFTLINHKIENALGQKKFNVCWIDKSLMIHPDTIKLISKNVKHVIHYSPDDMFNPKNQTKFYINSIPFYSLIITTKSFNVFELEKQGAKNVKYVSNCYDHNLHKKLILSKEDLQKFYTPVGFIGSFEEDRFLHILSLAKSGIPIKVFGKSWKKYKNIHKNLVVDPFDYYHNDYVKILNAIDINLCFLRKQNRDLQTQRSVEIPACSKLMIAERTSEHMDLFEENTEAVFFENGNYEELYQKVDLFLRNKSLAIRIGENAYMRCLTSSYSYKSQINNILNNLDFGKI